jgi:hypothetical protein
LVRNSLPIVTGEVLEVLSDSINRIGLLIANIPLAEDAIWQLANSLIPKQVLTAAMKHLLGFSSQYEGIDSQLFTKW